MSWAGAAIEALRRGEQSTLRYHGDAMQGRIDDGAERVLGNCVRGHPGQLVSRAWASTSRSKPSLRTRRS